MSDKPPNGNGRHGLVAGTIDRVLAYIDKPWKAVVIVVLMLLIGIGWIFHQNQERIVEAWLTPSTPELKTGDIPEALAKLTAETDAELVQIWAVDLRANAQWFLAERRHDGGERPVIPTPRRLPIIVNTSDVKSLIDILDGRATCVDLEKTGSPLARRLAERGMRRGCAIPIPPGPDSFVGVIYLAWSIPPDSSSEGVAVGAAREVARRLATH